jgi:acyl carrier protein phosphodiesterase
LNYLAHCFLSCSTEEILIGNFIADSISRKSPKTFSNEIQLGIALHKKIDTFTDKHPKVKEAVVVLRERHGKYAPVVSDILWDYYLANNWSLYSDETLEDFTTRTYTIFQKFKSQMPLRMSKNIDSMIAANFLLRYRSLEGLKESFGHMDRRTKFPSNFVDAIDDINENQDLFNKLFNEFFPDLIHLAKVECNCTH